MKKRLKIAIYSGEIPSTTFIERLITGLSETGLCDIFLFGIKARRVTYSNKVRVLGYTNSKLHKAFYLLTYSLLLFFLRRNDKKKLDTLLLSQSKNTLNNKVKCYPVLWHKPDIFHLQWAKGIGDWIWVQEFGMKLVVSLRGAHINYSPIADKKLASVYCRNFPKVDGFHAVSKAIAVEAQKYGATQDKIKVVYSGLELTGSKPDVVRKTPAVFQVLSVGRPHWKKGYTYALDACKLLKDQGFLFQYSIVGGCDDIELLYHIHDLGLADVVELTDKLPNERVMTRMQNTDLLLLPSVEEGVANVVLEAMSLGTLILTTDCGGMEEVIIDGITGFVVPKRDSKLIAETITSISKLSENKRNYIATNAYQKLLEQHTKSEMITRMYDFYKHI